MSDKDSIIPTTQPKGEINTHPDTPTGFDTLERILNLQQLHTVTAQQITAFGAAVEAILPANDSHSERYRALDLGTGAGFAAGLVARTALEIGRSIHIGLVDNNTSMLPAALAHVRKIGVSDPEGMISAATHLSDLSQEGALNRLNGVEPESLDLVVAKMLRHELPSYKQVALLADIHSVLKPGGSLLLWDVEVPADLRGQPLYDYTRVIRDKDVLLGIHRDREFTTYPLLEHNLNLAGFTLRPDKVLPVLRWDREWNSVHRWIVEFGNDDLAILKRLNDAITGYVPQMLRNQVNMMGTIREFMGAFATPDFIDQLETSGIDVDNKEHLVQGWSFMIGSAIIRIIK